LGTEIETYKNNVYVSLVGFMFLKTKVLHLPVPFHRNFEEVNLRFYVRKKFYGTWRRGVVFIREMVPKPVIAVVANTLYREHYEPVSMKHSWLLNEEQLISYSWKKKRWHNLKVIAENKPFAIAAGSEEEFITEQHYGYTKVNEHNSYEYPVHHPTWLLYPVNSFSVDADFGVLYGNNFAFLSSALPASVFLAEGSKVSVGFFHKLK
jgi:uncharacterized protein